MQRPLVFLVALALAAAGAAGCSGTGLGTDSGSSPGLPMGDRGTDSVPVPGDVRRAGREGIDLTPKQVLSDAEVEARRSRSVAVAEQLWRQAEAAENSNPGGAADAYRDIAEDHPESPRAAEAKFREGRGRYRARDYLDAFEAFRRYMEIAPTNQHLAEVEEMVFESGKRYLASVRGFSGVFKSKDEGYAMLQYVAATFPNGRLADDALLALGDALYREEDKDLWIKAVQHYRALLLRYPESDLRPAAHLGLALTYLVRDQGAPWHGGYVDLDPREETPTDAQQMAFAGAVESAPLLALETYTALLQEELLKEDRDTPGRASAAQLAAARQGVRTAKERLAAKDARIAAWYGGGSGGAAADPYRRSAAELRGLTAPPPLAPPAIPPRPSPSTPPPSTPPPSTQPPSTPPPSQPPAGPTLPPQPPKPTPPVTTPPVTPPTPPPTLPPTLPPTRPPTTVPPPVGPDLVPPATSNPPVTPPGVPAALPPPKIRRSAAVRPG